jgi:hypothetical protein
MNQPSTWQPSTWNDVRRIVDELELKVHLAAMDVRDRWRALQPRISKLEQTIEREGAKAGKVVSEELSAVGKVLRDLRDEIVDEIAEERGAARREKAEPEDAQPPEHARLDDQC